MVVWFVYLKFCFFLFKLKIDGDGEVFVEDDVCKFVFCFKCFDVMCEVGEVLMDIKIFGCDVFLWGMLE